MAGPHASLVVSTLGRSDTVAALLASLDRQTFGDFELIVVDQNDDDRLVDMLRDGAHRFPIEHVRRPGERGASRGRNVGWRLARGEKVLFPDDDCWYPDPFLEHMIGLMDSTGCDVLSGRAADETGRSINGRYENSRQVISQDNIWTTQIEWMVMFKRHVLEAVDGYDERIGVGASTPWQSGEAQDIMLRALAKGFKCLYDPEVIGHHLELNVSRPDLATCRKGRIYGRGMGYVLRLHKFGPLRNLSWVLRPLAGAVLNLPRNRARARYLLSVATGRAEGLVGHTLD